VKALGEASRDRGVRRAPFVVLIGAGMPSVLAEVAFLSNAREERSLKLSDYRQKVSEALFAGVSQYASSLSRFQVVERKGP
jgi:N-acetylmuramoyl-L-alanine amidase